MREPTDFAGRMQWQNVNVLTTIGGQWRLLEMAIENVGRPMVPTPVGLLFFVIALASLLLYGWHARRRDDPILDLRPPAEYLSPADQRARLDYLAWLNHQHEPEAVSERGSGHRLHGR